MVGAFVNDAKREVEDSWQWSHIMDYLTFTTTAGLSSYETNTMLTRYAAPPLNYPNGAGERARLWQDNVTGDALLLNVTLNFESRLTYQPVLTDQIIKQKILNQPTQELGPPSVWQLAQSTFFAAPGMWNKAVLLYNLPDIAYTMQLFIVNPQDDLVADGDVMKVPTAPVVQKAYLYCLYERGEELGERMDLTVQKVEDTLSAAITLDQQLSQQFLALSIPQGSQY